MSKPRIGIVIGSTRPARFADRPAQWIFDLAARRGDFEVEMVDLRDYPLPFFEEDRSPAWGPLKGEVAQAWQRKVASLDGYVFTAAEYNRGPTAVLKNALDHAYTEWNGKPAAFVGYGGVGAARAIEQLRLHAVELQMAPIRAGVHILMADFVALMKGEAKLGEIAHLEESAKGMLDQFAWWAKALKAARAADAAQAEAA